MAFTEQTVPEPPAIVTFVTGKRVVLLEAIVTAEHVTDESMSEIVNARLSDAEFSLIV